MSEVIFEDRNDGAIFRILAPEQQNVEISDFPLKLYLSKLDFTLRNTRTNDILQEFWILIRSLRLNCLWDLYEIHWSFLSPYLSRWRLTSVQVFPRENNYQYRSRSYDLGKTQWYQCGEAWVLRKPTVSKLRADWSGDLSVYLPPPLVSDHLENREVNTGIFPDTLDWSESQIWKVQKVVERPRRTHNLFTAWRPRKLWTCKNYIVNRPMGQLNELEFEVGTGERFRNSYFCCSKCLIFSSQINMKNFSLAARTNNFATGTFDWRGINLTWKASLFWCVHWRIFSYK